MKELYDRRAKLHLMLVMLDKFSKGIETSIPASTYTSAYISFLNRNDNISREVFNFKNVSKRDSIYNIINEYPTHYDLYKYIKSVIDVIDRVIEESFKPMDNVSRMDDDMLMDKINTKLDRIDELILDDFL